MSLLGMGWLREGLVCCDLVWDMDGWSGGCLRLVCWGHEVFDGYGGCASISERIRRGLDGK